MPPPAPVSASVSTVDAPPPLPASLDSVATTDSTESFNNNDHLSDDDDDSDSDDDGIRTFSDSSSSNNNNDSNTSSNSVGSAIPKYEVVRELGRGATAVVQLGRLRGGDELVALKVFKTSLLRKMREVKRVGRRMVVSTALDKVQVEIAIMKKLHHPNLLNLLEVFDDDTETLVLMLEYAPSGQVMQWFPEEKVYRKIKSKGQKKKQSSEECFSEDELRICDGTFKIADFGVAHFFEEDKTDDANAAKSRKKGYVSSTAGTYAFMGPETLKGGEYSAYAADIWALGITIHALAFGTIPFYDPDVVTLFEQIEKQPIVLKAESNNNNGVSEDFVELLYGLLEKDPEKRWSLQQCKEHPWVLEGLSEEEKKRYVETSYEAVKVGPEDLASAVTRVTSLSVILRVKLGANKWKRKAMRTLEDRRKSLHERGSSFGESRLSGVELPETNDTETKAPTNTETLSNNQLEI
ncbi:hypothetical protein PHYBOEH_007834 [Phytophthora boehmeriae]|uniref:Protein kinase domain-containing protein n=1 Tax=Phytophthora boehmeriae TaxID=109152 RepID=A0A8T1X1S6_9STRA|nr:hypothetical protein PHYBOEH_007834 [Phytophthora boehmeriae]